MAALPTALGSNQRAPFRGAIDDVKESTSEAAPTAGSVVMGPAAAGLGPVEGVVPTGAAVRPDGPAPGLQGEAEATKGAAAPAGGPATEHPVAPPTQETVTSAVEMAAAAASDLRRVACLGVAALAVPEAASVMAVVTPLKLPLVTDRALAGLTLAAVTETTSGTLADTVTAGTVRAMVVGVDFAGRYGSSLLL